MSSINRFIAAAVVLFATMMFWIGLYVVFNFNAVLIVFAICTWLFIVGYGSMTNDRIGRFVRVEG